MEADDWLAGRYHLRRPVGAGGIGQVWAAHDAVLGREVAVKVQEIDPDEDHAAFERFVREARSAAALQHPNVVTIFDSGTDGDVAFLVMELLLGPTLTGYLAQHGPLPERDAVDLAAQVASGLAAAHGAGVVHRDIKPANLMFDARGTLKIVDFGIARLTQTVAPRLTARNAVIGSPSYLSPEQVQGQQVDRRSDIYCFGGVMMTMLTARPPFEGSDSFALLQQHLHAAPPRVRDRRPGVDPALDALVVQMLNKSPADRPQSAREVLDRLTGSAHSESTWIARAPTAANSDRTTEPSAADAPRTAAAQPRTRSSLGLGALAGAAAMALVAAVIVAVTTVADAPTVSSTTPSHSAPLPVAAQARQAKPSPSAPPPTERKARRSTPSPGAPTAAVPSRQTTSRQTSSRPIAPQTSDTDSDEPDLRQALFNVHTAVGEASNSGHLDAKKAVELSKRIDVLADHLERKRGEDATKKLDEMDKYVSGLVRKGDVTPGDGERIATALARLRDVAVDG